MVSRIMTDAPRPYHHGGLVEAMIAATVELIEERGVEDVSLREAAKRAGVSPGAPFRHFKSKTALMTAVAEQSMARLASAIAGEMPDALLDDPVAALQAMGHGYLRWAVDNPIHFRIVSSRTLIDFDGSAFLTGENARLRRVMMDILSRARDQGRLPADTDLDLTLLSTRAFAYGLARMYVDGQFPEWHPHAPPVEAMRRAVDAYVARLFTT